MLNLGLFLLIVLTIILYIASKIVKDKKISNIISNLSLIFGIASIIMYGIIFGIISLLKTTFCATLIYSSCLLIEKSKKSKKKINLIIGICLLVVALILTIII